MKKLALLLCLFLVAGISAPRKLATPNIVPYSFLNVTLMRLSNPHLVPSLVKTIEDGYARQFSLNTAEVTALDTAVQQLRNATVKQRPSVLAQVTPQFLNAIRPQTQATLLQYAAVSEAQTPNTGTPTGATYSDLNSIQRCLADQLPGVVSNGKTYCILASSDTPYAVDTPLIFTLSNHVLAGSGYSFWSTTLQRHSPLITNLVSTMPGVTNVGVQDITLDGNRFAFEFDQPGYKGCSKYDGFAWSVADLNFGGPSYSFVWNTAVVNSPGTGIQMLNGTIKDSMISSARVTGVMAGTTGNLGGPESNNNGFVTLTNSLLFLNGTAAVTMNGWGNVTENIFILNRYEQPDGVSGGQVTGWNTAEKINLDGNYINALSYITPANGLIPTKNGISGALTGSTCPVAPNLGNGGIEVDGHIVSMRGNTVINMVVGPTGQGGAGILVHQGVVDLSAIDPNTGATATIGNNSYGVSVYATPAASVAYGPLVVVNNSKAGVVTSSGVTGPGFVAGAGMCFRNNGTNSLIDFGACDPSRSNLCYNPAWNRPWCQ